MQQQKQSSGPLGGLPVVELLASSLSVQVQGFITSLAKSTLAVSTNASAAHRTTFCQSNIVPMIAYRRISRRLPRGRLNRINKLLSRESNGVDFRHGLLN